MYKIVDAVPSMINEIEVISNMVRFKTDASVANVEGIY